MTFCVHHNFSVVMVHKKKNNRIVLLLQHHPVTPRTVILYSDHYLNKSTHRHLIKINYRKSKSTSTQQIAKLKSAQRVIK